MNAVGLIGVTARIAELQQRFAAVPAFSGALAAGGAGSASAAAASAAAASAAVAPVGSHGMPQAAMRLPAATSAPAAAPGAGAAASSGPAGGWATRLPAAGRPWAGAIERVAAAAGVDPSLLAALVDAESGFRADARSSAGAIGLGQLLPATARALGVDPHDPEQNLTGAARYLKQQLDRFGSVELALAAYNAGPGRVAQAGGVPRIAETQAYVAKVTATYQQLRSA